MIISLYIVGLFLSLQSESLAVDLKYAGSTTVQMGVMYEAAALYKKKYGKNISVMGEVVGPELGVSIFLFQQDGYRTWQAPSGFELVVLLNMPETLSCPAVSSGGAL